MPTGRTAAPYAYYLAASAYLPADVPVVIPTLRRRVPFAWPAVFHSSPTDRPTDLPRQPPLASHPSFDLPFDLPFWRAVPVALSLPPCTP